MSNDQNYGVQFKYCRQENYIIIYYECLNVNDFFQDSFRRNLR
jgi:hypothetical protein